MNKRIEGLICNRFVFVDEHLLYHVALSRAVDLLVTPLIEYDLVGCDVRANTRPNVAALPHIDQLAVFQ